MYILEYSYKAGKKITLQVDNKEELLELVKSLVNSGTIEINIELIG
jgi:peptidyl-tRNA hydrolase